VSDEGETNPLIRRVDALVRSHREEARRADEEVPLLTEVVGPGSEGFAAPAPAREDALAADLERALVARLAPEFERRLAGLRLELERDLRRAVREAVAHALAARKAEPPAE
jgi:hypothetical protein